MRYIVFDTPPTVSYCLSTAAQQAIAAEAEDYTFRTRLEDLQRPPSAAVLVLPADEEEEEEEEEEQDDAESWVKSFGPDLTRVGSEGSSSDEESDVDDESLLQDIALDKEMDAEGDTKLHGPYLSPLPARTMSTHHRRAQDSTFLPPKTPRPFLNSVLSVLRPNRRYFTM